VGRVALRSSLPFVALDPFLAIVAAWDITAHVAVRAAPAAS